MCGSYLGEVGGKGQSSGLLLLGSFFITFAEILKFGSLLQKVLKLGLSLAAAKVLCASEEAKAALG